MTHNYVSLYHPIHQADGPDHLTSAHWAVGHNADCLLLQVNDGQEESRIKLTREEALMVAKTLIDEVITFQREDVTENGR